MLQRLDFLEQKYEELSIKISDPEVMSNQKEWQKLCKDHSELEVITLKYREYKKVLDDIEYSKEMLDDEEDKEFRELAQEEIKELQNNKITIENELKILLLPKDPNDEKNVFVEIRAGTGGDEAALFAANLFRMYSKYVENKRWKIEMISVNDTDIGGFK